MSQEVRYKAAVDSLAWHQVSAERLFIYTGHVPTITNVEVASAHPLCFFCYRFFNFPFDISTTDDTHFMKKTTWVNSCGHR